MQIGANVLNCPCLQIYLPFSSSVKSTNFDVSVNRDRTDDTTYTTSNAPQTHNSKWKVKRGNIDIKHFENVKHGRHTRLYKHKDREMWDYPLGTVSGE